jgi:hypothetical protein
LRLVNGKLKEQLGIKATVRNKNKTRKQYYHLMTKL